MTRPWCNSENGPEPSVARLGKRGASDVDGVVRYEDACRLRYVRGPGGMLIGLAEQLC
ncbi:MAG: hypothetical protein JWM31_2739 [Solirubrobacterales bacterium]|nr:hypothetical protein [Solirubrobacterales bacterium]